MKTTKTDVYKRLYEIPVGTRFKIENEEYIKTNLCVDNYDCIFCTNLTTGDNISIEMDRQVNILDDKIAQISLGEVDVYGVFKYMNHIYIKTNVLIQNRPSKHDSCVCIRLGNRNKIKIIFAKEIVEPVQIKEIIYE